MLQEIGETHRFGVTRNLLFNEDRLCVARSLGSLLRAILLR